MSLLMKLPVFCPEHASKQKPVITQQRSKNKMSDAN